MSGHREEGDMSEIPSTGLERSREALERIQAALRGLRYGTVTAVVQDGVVVQVERTEKIRLEKPSPADRHER
jgi:hypothetical protein